MGLMDMNRGIKKYAPWIFGALAVPFVVSVVYTGFGSSLGIGGGRGGGPAAGPRTASGSGDDKTVAVVGGVDIKRGALDEQIAALAKGSQIPPLMLDEIRYTVLNKRSKQQAALVAVAKAAGVTASDSDIAAQREKVWAMQRPQVAPKLGLPATATDAQIDEALQKQDSGVSAASLKARINDDDVKINLYQQGLLSYFKKQTKADEASVKRSYDDIQVRHILIASGNSGLPDAQAKVKADKIMAEVKADPSKMPALAQQYSDDPGSKTKGGFYDWAPASQYVAAFTKAALDAGVGKVYPEPVKTQFGYHIIKLEGERPGKDFPKDWDKNKQKYIDEYVDKEAQQAAVAAITAQDANIKVEVLDPGIKAAQLEADAKTAPDNKSRDAKLALALDELGKVAKEDDRSGVVPLRKAAILEQLGRDKDAIAAYQDSLKFRNTVDTHLSLAQLYLKSKDKASTVKELDEAQKLPIPDPNLMSRVGLLYMQAGDPAKSKIALEKSAELQKRQAQVDAADAKAAAASKAPLAPAPMPDTAVKPVSAVPTPPARSSVAVPSTSARTAVPAIPMPKQ